MSFGLINNKGCSLCSFCSNRQNIINGRGPSNAKIFVIADSPGLKEDEIGLPFHGPAASLLKQLMGRVEINYTEVFFSYLCRCACKTRDPKKPIKEPSAEEIAKCSPFLEQEIATIKPNVIVPLGNLPLRYILQSKTTNITSNRGLELWSDKYNCKIMPIHNPGSILRQPKFEGVTIEDLSRIKLASESKEITIRKDPIYIVADTREKLTELFNHLSTVPEVSIDLETTSLDWMTGKIISIGFCWKAGEGWCLPLLKAGGDSSKFWDDVTYDFIISELKRVMLLPSKKLGWNFKFDLEWLVYRGIRVNNVYFDGILAHALLFDNAENMHGLKDCAWTHTSYGGYEAEVGNFFKEHKKLKRQYIYLPFDVLTKYNSFDATVTYEICKKLESALQEQGLMRLFRQLVMPMSEVLLETEMAGVQVDKEYIEKLRVTHSARRDILEQKIYQAVGQFKINSPLELRNVLFKKLKLKPVKKTDKGALSTDQESLETLANIYPDQVVPKLLVEYRGVQKLLSTFIEGLAKHVMPDSRIHAGYSQFRTATGRLSCLKPNLQQVPRPNPDRPEDDYIRGIFIAKPGYKLIECDYKAAEFRKWAEHSHDPQMIEDIKTGLDIHKLTASSSLGIPMEQVTKRQRQDAKAIVFGLMYGRGIWSISQELGISEEEAKRIVRTFFGRYPKAEAWLKQQVWLAKKTGQVASHFGRIRRLPGINSPNEAVRGESERQSKNCSIQSSSSDTTCTAAIRIRRKFKELGLRGQLVITVHDSLLYEVPNEEVIISSHIIKEEAERPVVGTVVKMEVEDKIGTRWGYLSEKEFDQAIATDVKLLERVIV